MLLPVGSSAGAFAAHGVPGAAEQARTDEELFLAWKGLDEGSRAETIEWFLAECDNAKHFGAQLERFVLTPLGGKRFDWPAASAPPIYTAERHAPAQIIPRRLVDESKEVHAKVVTRLIRDRGDDRRLPAFRYDWGRGTVVTLRPWDDPERIAYGAARGQSPYASLMEAVVTMRLDDGAMRSAAAAFGHTYSDRGGNAYPSVTLYDAWSSGTEIEMPDVECLGVLHDLEDDWKSFVAPVPGSRQRRLYDRIGKHYSSLRKHRGLRDALARCYADGAPVLPGSYGPSLMRLNGFWEIMASDPARLADDLPDEESWGDWFMERGAEVDDSLEVLERSRARVRSLAESSAWTRRTFEGILREYGAFDPRPPANEAGDKGDAGGDAKGGDK